MAYPCGWNSRVPRHSETTVKPLIDDLYVNGWKSWLPVCGPSSFTARFDRCASVSRANARNNYHGGHEVDCIYVLEIAINEITMVNMVIFICPFFIYLFIFLILYRLLLSNNKEVILIFWL